MFSVLKWILTVKVVADRPRLSAGVLHIFRSELQAEESTATAVLALLHPAVDPKLHTIDGTIAAELGLRISLPTVIATQNTTHVVVVVTHLAFPFIFAALQHLGISALA